MASTGRDLHIKALVGARLRVMRAALGLQQNELADMVNITQQTLSGWENGRDLADPLAVARLALRYNLSTDWVWLGSLNSMPRWLAEEIERRRPDLVPGATSDAQPAARWDKPDLRSAQPVKKSA